jgi:AcrR family transcriptional regulator
MLRPSSRDRILDVASQIASDEGASQLTIDAVAKRAGISKGGVMYHFGSKDEMLSALVDRVTQLALTRLSESAALLGNRACSMLDALIDEGLRSNPAEDALISGLLGAVANNPALAKPAANAYSAVYRRFESMEAMAPNALVVALALDGLLFLRLLKLVSFDATNIERLRTVLKRLAEAPLVELPEAKTRKSAKLNAAAESSKKAAAGRKSIAGALVKGR